MIKHIHTYICTHIHTIYGYCSSISKPVSGFLSQWKAKILLWISKVLKLFKQGEICIINVISSINHLTLGHSGVRLAVSLSPWNAGAAAPLCRRHQPGKTYWGSAERWESQGSVVADRHDLSHSIVGHVNWPHTSVFMSLTRPHPTCAFCPTAKCCASPCRASLPLITRAFPWAALCFLRD